jgi:hypothetical protein
MSLWHGSSRANQPESREMRPLGGSKPVLRIRQSQTGGSWCMMPPGQRPRPAAREMA